MQNCIGLAGDGDDLDVVYAVEETFGIKLTKEEAESTRTVGQLYDLVEAKVGADKAEHCLSQHAFYLLRKALQDRAKTRKLVPDTPIAVVYHAPGSTIRQKWIALAEITGLKLPPLEAMHSRRWALALTTAFLVPGVLIFSADLIHVLGKWCTLLVLALPVPWLLVERLWIRIFGDVPARIKTIGDLAREAAGFSYSKLIAGKGYASRHDRWFGLSAILRGQSGYQGPINRSTTFISR
jgi:hypothetical protein